jgi:hypothetical protein
MTDNRNWVMCPLSDQASVELDLWSLRGLLRSQTAAIARLEHLVEMLRAKSIGEFAGLVPKVMVFS